MGRIDKAFKNIFFGSLGNFSTIIIRFISRSVFIHILGTTLLGVNGLYTNILTVLSFAELGIGTAMNYSLYEPIAKNDIEKLKALMSLYRKAYFRIACIVSIVGLSIIPFLKYIITDPGSISSNELILYYLIFLFNTVSTYFVSYKYSLANANQEGYIQTNIHTLTVIITTIVQIISLYIFRSFLIFLLIQALIGLIEKIFISSYFNKKYRFLKEKDIVEVSNKDKEILKFNVKALIFHKIGEVGVHQTDNIIISSFINVTTVGLVSNYTLIITSIKTFIGIFFNSIIGGLGNLIATEDIERQLSIFKVYRFLGFWLYGFSSVAFYTLLPPFINIWVGEELVLSNLITSLIIIDFYLTGERGVSNNFKTAAGFFNDDKYVPFIQAIVNLLISIFLVRQLGLVGVYFGTIIASLIPMAIKPYVIYRIIFNENILEYFKDSVKYISATLLAILVIDFLKNLIYSNSFWFNFSFQIILVLILTNFLFYILFRKTEELKYIKEIVLIKISKLKK